MRFLRGFGNPVASSPILRSTLESVSSLPKFPACFYTAVSLLIHRLGHLVCPLVERAPGCHYRECVETNQKPEKSVCPEQYAL